MSHAPMLLLAILFLPAVAVGSDKKADVKETNKPEVQDSLKNGWDKVVFGKEFDHEEYAKTGIALAASLATENPAPLAGYLREFVEESVKTIAADVKQEVILMALKNPDKVFTAGGLEISGGFATYNHKKAIGVELPDKVEIDGLNIAVRKRMEWVVTDLPNTFQPYIRLRQKK